MRSKGDTNNIALRVMMRPTPIQVANLQRTHGWEMCVERWCWIDRGTLGQLASQGRKQLQHSEA